MVSLQLVATDRLLKQQHLADKAEALSSFNNVTEFKLEKLLAAGEKLRFNGRTSFDVTHTHTKALSETVQ